RRAAQDALMGHLPPQGHTGRAARERRGAGCGDGNQEGHRRVRDRSGAPQAAARTAEGVTLWRPASGGDDIGERQWTKTLNAFSRNVALMGFAATTRRPSII